MQVRCKVCSTEFAIGDEVVRLLQARNGTVPCRKCRTPVPLGGEPSVVPPAPKKTSAPPNAETTTTKSAGPLADAAHQGKASVPPKAAGKPVPTSIWSPGGAGRSVVPPGGTARSS